MRTGAQLRAKLLAGVALLGSLAGGCRCGDETLAPVIFDQEEHTDIDANSVLAPPWQLPVVSQLDNGAVLHWLQEPRSPAFHVRLLLPTAVDADKLNAAATAAVLEALSLRLGSRIRRIPDAHTDLRSRPGRVEIALHGRDSDAERLLEVLARTLADTGSSKLLATAQGKVLARHREAGPSALSTAALVAKLLDHPLAHEYAAKQDLVDLSKKSLERGWSLLTNPRDALVVVHSGRDPEDEEMAAALAELGERWKAPLGFGSGKGAVTARLREAPPKKGSGAFLLTETDAAPLTYFEGKPEKGNRAVVMIGRLIPTPTIEARALARMSQRLMQEEFDVRLLVAGPVSLLAIKVRVSAKDPVLSLQRIIARMQEIAAVAPPRSRLTQATQLWLGARVVEASLAGEDWTSLWSDSIDLASEDREIFVALARDAQTMLSLEPATVQDFMLEWFNPQGGEPGWVWTAAGVDQNFATKLGAGVVLVEG